MPRLFPSLIAANPLFLGETIRELEPWCDGFHIDIMDNHFAPNIYGSADLINAIAQQTKKIIWVHLMIDQPHTFITRLDMPKSSIVSVHIENKNRDQAHKEIRQKSWLASIAINPSTPIEALDNNIIEQWDHILMMSVNPGFSGQSFIPESTSKIKELQKRIKIKNFKKNIGIDGGITKNEITNLLPLGVSDFVIGHSIFSNKNYKDICAMIQDYLQTFRNN